MFAGCAATPEAPPGADRQRVSCMTEIQPEMQVHLDLVDAMIDRGKPYAALAQLESKRLSTEDHWLRRGQLLAMTGHLSQAEHTFRQLVDQCHSGRSYHGLGMTLLKQSRLEEALPYLEKARVLAPASADVRNDYGYALLLAHRPYEAATELRTALELNSGKGPVRQNLATAYMLTQNQAGLDLLRDRYHFGVDEYAYARKLARELGGQP
ncbi:hypothetical protein EZI54_16555 [Marinobacter halodurans]|uniref:Tetratricopeptide repeat protein n=1 Tax=Marinobacter halodurans TaxID=2528979 RepID=A0ABY1ZH17_9GAMM|nr:hypothetical protein EZI54_16555 [Marinobacter halodurans]